jgi:hypothetical protein
VVRRWVAVDIQPVNSTEPRMSLSAGLVVSPSTSEKKNTFVVRHLDEICAIHAAGRIAGVDERAPPRRHDHRVRPSGRRRRLRSQPLFRLAKELLHELDAFVGDLGPRREAQRLSPVQDLLPGDMALRPKKVRVSRSPPRTSRYSTLTELLTNGG